MTRDEVIDLAIARLEDSAKDSTGKRARPQWNDAFLEDAMDSAMREVAERCWILRKSFSLQTSDGINEYSLAHRSVYQVERVYLPDFKRTLKRRSREWLDNHVEGWHAQTGMPILYLFDASGRITFWPTPLLVAGQANTPPLAEIFIYRLPLPGEELTEFPVQYHRDMAWWIVHECCSIPDQDTFYPELSALALQKFTMRFGERKSARWDNAIRNNDESIFERGRIA